MCRPSSRRSRSPRTSSQKCWNCARAIARSSTTPASSSSTSRKAHRIVDGRLVGPNGKPFMERTESGLPKTETGVLSGASKLLSWVPGRGVDIHRADVGKRIPAGKYLNWQMHYNPTGKPEKDRSRLGIWFNKVPVTHELLIRQAGDPLATDKDGLSLYRVEGKEVEYKADPGSTRRSRTTPNIPPYAENWSIIGITPVTEPITLYAMSPHMHLRGKSLRWIIVYPDGREQTILDVPNFDFNWQFNYELKEPLHIPAGSKILGLGVYHNSVKNRWNPAPHLPVYGPSKAGTRCIRPSRSTPWTARCSPGQARRAARRVSSGTFATRALRAPGLVTVPTARVTRATARFAAPPQPRRYRYIPGTRQSGRRIVEHVRPFFGEHDAGGFHLDHVHPEHDHPLALGHETSLDRTAGTSYR